MRNFPPRKALKSLETAKESGIIPLTQVAEFPKLAPLWVHVSTYFDGIEVAVGDKPA